MDPATILTKEDYERPRTVEQLWDWWHAKYNLLASTNEGRLYSREGKGLTKKFHDEAHPMLAFLRHYHLGSNLFCRFTAGDEKADAQLIDKLGAVVGRFQITTAVDGHTEAIRRRQLSRVGHVDGLSKPDEHGVIHDDGLPMDHFKRIKEMAGYVAQAVENKSSKGYDKDFTLIVGFEDGTYDPEDLPQFRALVGHLSHSFAQLYIVGIHGRISIP